MLRALWNLRLRGDEGATPVGEREWYREALDEPDPERQLRLNARNSRAGKEHVGDVLEVIRAAAAVEPQIATLWSRIQDEYYENQRAIVERLHRNGAPSA